MNKAFLTVGIILLGILALAGINLVGNYSMGNELDYYTLKETSQAAMTDAVDHVYYSTNGTLRIDKEKFMESFLLRFANTVNNNRNYEIKVYDINEVPPKVSIEIKAGNISWNPDKKEGQVEIVTRLDGILISNSKTNPIATKLKKEGKV